jgi:predicted acyl esterase
VGELTIQEIGRVTNTCRALLALACIGFAHATHGQTPVQAPAPYAFRIERRWLLMPDGVRLAATIVHPIARTKGEHFPVLLEYLPYRKEDSFYIWDYQQMAWYARHGYIVAEVDIRGTGSSEGHLPPREYSDEELGDADTIIAQLAALGDATGAVGMYGISWGGFNSIQIAMRHPPALKAIIASMATDDLFHDDVRYIDGVLHVDQYALQIDHENGLPAPPAYRIDAAYVRDRFDAEPWIFTYLRHSVDSDWWRAHSLRFHYDAMRVPSLLVGGQLDGYRDAIPRMLDSVRAPVKALIGPWKHDDPGEADPGPSIAWRELAIRWWDHWLKGRENGVMDEPRLTVFVRDAHAPDASMTMTPGEWRFEDWPIARTQWRTWYPSRDHQLSDTVRAPRGVDSLRYLAGVGTAAPVWWGDPTGNMAGDDGGSLVYDSPILRDTVEIIGFPRVRLRVSASAPVADWTVRLEDVWPTGEAGLVTGALVSGPERDSRTSPEPLVPGLPVRLSTALHFTTWRFLPGHRIRLAVSNAQFPMAWPTAAPMTTELTTNDPQTVLELPTIPAVAAGRTPEFLPATPDPPAPDAHTLDSGHYPGALVTRDENAKTTALDFRNAYGYAIGRRTIRVVETEHYSTRDDAPWDSRFLGDEVHTIRTAAGHQVRLHTVIAIVSDRDTLHVTETRSIYQDGALVHRKVWQELIPRGLH